MSVPSAVADGSSLPMQTHPLPRMVLTSAYNQLYGTIVNVAV